METAAKADAAGLEGQGEDAIVAEAIRLYSGNSENANPNSTSTIAGSTSAVAKQAASRLQNSAALETLKLDLKGHDPSKAEPFVRPRVLGGAWNRSGSSSLSKRKRREGAAAVDDDPRGPLNVEASFRVTKPRVRSGPAWRKEKRNENDRPSKPDRPGEETSSRDLSTRASTSDASLFENSDRVVRSRVPGGIIPKAGLEAEEESTKKKRRRKAKVSPGSYKWEDSWSKVVAKRGPSVASWGPPPPRPSYGSIFDDESDTEMVGSDIFAGNSDVEYENGNGGSEKQQDLSTLSLLSINSAGTMSMMSDRGSRIEEPAVGFAAGGSVEGRGGELTTRERRIASFRQRERLRRERLGPGAYESGSTDVFGNKVGTGGKSSNSVLNKRGAFAKAGRGLDDRDSNDATTEIWETLYTDPLLSEDERKRRLVRSIVREEVAKKEGATELVAAADLNFQKVKARSDRGVVAWRRPGDEVMTRKQQKALQKMRKGKEIEASKGRYDYDVSRSVAYLDPTLARGGANFEASAKARNKTEETSKKVKLRKELRNPQKVGKNGEKAGDYLATQLHQAWAPEEKQGSNRQQSSSTTLTDIFGAEIARNSENLAALQNDADVLAALSAADFVKGLQAASGSQQAEQKDLKSSVQTLGPFARRRPATIMRPPAALAKAAAKAKKMREAAEERMGPGYYDVASTLTVGDDGKNGSGMGMIKFGADVSTGRDIVKVSKAGRKHVLPFNAPMDKEKVDPYFLSGREHVWEGEDGQGGGGSGGGTGGSGPNFDKALGRGQVAGPHGERPQDAIDADKENDVAEGDILDLKPGFRPEHRKTAAFTFRKEGEHDWGHDDEELVKEEGDVVAIDPARARDFIGKSAPGTIAFEKQIGRNLLGDDDDKENNSDDVWTSDEDEDSESEADETENEDEEEDNEEDEDDYGEESFQAMAGVSGARKYSFVEHVSEDEAQHHVKRILLEQEEIPEGQRQISFADWDGDSNLQWPLRVSVTTKHEGLATARERKQRREARRIKRETRKRERRRKKRRRQRRRLIKAMTKEAQAQNEDERRKGVEKKTPAFSFAGKPRWEQEDSESDEEEYLDIDATAVKDGEAVRKLGGKRGVAFDKMQGREWVEEERAERDGLSLSSEEEGDYQTRDTKDARVRRRIARRRAETAYRDAEYDVERGYVELEARRDTFDMGKMGGRSGRGFSGDGDDSEDSGVYATDHAEELIINPPVGAKYDEIFGKRVPGATDWSKSKTERLPAAADNDDDDRIGSDVDLRRQEDGDPVAALDKLRPRRDKGGVISRQPRFDDPVAEDQDGIGLEEELVISPTRADRERALRPRIHGGVPFNLAEGRRARGPEAGSDRAPILSPDKLDFGRPRLRADVDMASRLGRPGLAEEEEATRTEEEILLISPTRARDSEAISRHTRFDVNMRKGLSRSDVDRIERATSGRDHGENPSAQADFEAKQEAFHRERSRRARQREREQDRLRRRRSRARDKPEQTLYYESDGPETPHGDATPAMSRPRAKRTLSVREILGKKTVTKAERKALRRAERRAEKRRRREEKRKAKERKEDEIMSLGLGVGLKKAMRRDERSAAAAESRRLDREEDQVFSAWDRILGDEDVDVDDHHTRFSHK